MNDAELARNYILGRLCDDDRAACERRFLFDAAFETVLHEQERELLDDQVHGRLSPADSEAVLDQLSQFPGRIYRLRFAEGLSRASIAAEEAQRQPSFVERARSIFAGRLLAWTAVVVAAAVAVFIAVSVERNRTPPAVSQSASFVAPAPVAPKAPQSSHPSALANPNLSGSVPASVPAPSTMATFVLLADQQRGAGDEPTLRLAPSIKLVRLQLTTEEGLEPGRFAANVSAAFGARIFSATDLAPRTEAGRRYIDLRLNPASLADGDYTIELTSESTSSNQPALRYRFAVLAPRSAAAK